MQKTKKIKFKPYLIPSILTVCSLFAGFLSIISSTKGSYEHAVGYIFAAFILDGLDGRVARKLNAASDFGRELDSLCDLVAFGVAPAVLVWHWLFRQSFDEFGVLASFVFVAGGATRLARFNVTTTADPKNYFIGLPIPAAAAALTSLVYAFVYAFPSGFRLQSENFTYVVASIVLLYCIALGGLMVSTFHFSSFKRVRLDDYDPRKLFVVLAIVVALVWKFNRVAVAILLFGYVLSGLRSLWGSKKPETNNQKELK